MKICITSQGNTLESQVDPRFGRCQYFVVHDTETSQSEFIDNKNKDGMGGVGVQSGQMIIEKGVKAVLTGNVGPNAYRTLEAGNIEIITGVFGKLKEVIESYEAGKYKATDGPSVKSHFGMPPEAKE